MSKKLKELREEENKGDSNSNPLDIGVLNLLGKKSKKNVPKNAIKPSSIHSNVVGFMDPIK